MRAVFVTIALSVLAGPVQAEWLEAVVVQPAPNDLAVLVEAFEENQAGGALAAQNDFAGARVHYERALALQPTHDLYLANVAAACWWLGELERAADHFRRAARAAVDAGARDRMALWHQKLSALLATPPASVNAKRQKASAPPDGPELQAEVQRAWQLYQAATGSMQGGALGDAHGAARAALEIALKVYGANHLTTAAYLNLAADVLMAAEKADQARPLYERAVGIASATLGKSFVDTLVYRHNLAVAFRQLGEHGRAETELRQVVKQSVGAWGDRHPMTATYMWSLASTLRAEGRTQEAARLLEGAYRRREASLGPLHPDTLQVLDELTGLLIELDHRDLNRLRPLLLEEARVNSLAFGDTSPAAVGTAWNLAEILIRAEELGEAARQYERIWRLLQRATGDTGVQAESVLGRLDEIYAALNQRERVVGVWERMVDLRAATHGGDHVLTWHAQKELSELYQEVGRFADALPLALHLVTSVDEADPRRVTALSNLGLLLHSMGDYERARAVLEEAVALCDQNRDQPATLEVLNNVALVYSSMGLYHLARPLYEQVLRARLELLPEKDPETLRSMHNLASIYMKQGLLDRAEPLFESVLRLRTEVLGETHASTLESLNSLALLKSSRGSYAEAQPLLERVLRLRRKHLGPSHPRTLHSLGDLALFYVQQGRLDRAEPLARSLVQLCRETLGEEHPDTLSAINDLALLLHHEGEYRAAAPMFERALATSRDRLGEAHPDTLRLANNLAETSGHLGRADDAEKLHRSTVELARASLGARHPETLIYIGNLANLELRRGDHAAAEPLFLEALAGKREVFGPSHPETLTALDNAAVFYQVEGDMERALGLWRQYATATTAFLDHVLWGADEETRHAYVRAQLMNDLLLVSFFAQLGAHEDSLALLLNRKGLLLRVSSEITATTRASEDPALRELALSLAAARRELAQRTLSGPGAQPPRLFDARQRQLERTIRTRSAAIGQAVRQLARARLQVTGAQVVDALGEDEILLELVFFVPHDLRTLELGNTEVAALVVDRAADPPVSFVRLGEAAPAAKAVREFRAAVSSPGSTPSATLDARARELYDRLWAPLAGRLADKRTIYVAPDGFLNVLPFAALVAPDGHYLVEKYDITVVASSRDLVVPPSAGQGGAAEVFSAPAYHFPDAKPRAGRGRTRGANLRDVRFVPLPGTAREAERIVELFSKRRQPALHHSGVDALEAAVMAVEHPRVLHLATHGFFLDPESLPARRDNTRGLILASKADPATPRARLEASPNPLLRAGLAFVGANQGVRGKKLRDGSDGVLTALEVLDIDLAGTDLVVLSACDTGVGQWQYGSGVAGLRSAFQEAGARAVLSTLWPIDDAATAAFMEQFYGAFLGGAGPQMALRRVQRSMLAEKRWSHPFFWAPFVVSGRDF